MKVLLSILSACVVIISANKIQDQPSDPIAEYASYFEELKMVTAKNKSFWGLDLYSPVMIVNPDTRQIYANSPDKKGDLRKQGDLYTGVLPEDIPMANTSTTWNGVEWAMILSSSLSKNYHDRINLMVHECFHKHQKELGFQSREVENKHLDAKDGRILVRLELEALKVATETNDLSNRLESIKDALKIRKLRHNMFNEAKENENMVEVNEGMAEYTGLMLSNRGYQPTMKHFKRRIESFVSSPSFTRSFAYEMIPVYGYFLWNITGTDWHREITNDTHLSNFFYERYEVNLANINLEELKVKYDSEDKIHFQEAKRERDHQKLIDHYKKILINDPHLELPLREMNMSFDYSKIISLENFGTVYPVINLTDHWGTLKVEKGSLISPEWNKISVSRPMHLDHSTIKGEGWELNLNEGYKVITTDSVQFVLINTH